MPTELTTSVGRIVWGHPAKARPKTDNKTKLPVLGADGQPRQQWAFGVAFDKASFQAGIWPAMAAEAATLFPQGVPPAFSWKWTDGDTVDREGKPFNIRPGYAGCYVLAISTELQAPPIFKLVNGAYQQMPGEAIKCGDFVSVGLMLKANVPTDKTQTPGLYVNPTAIEFVGYGEEIVSANAVDPMATFKGAQHALPPGASATPMAHPGAPGLPGMGAPAPAFVPPVAPPPPPPVMAGPARPVDPAHIAPNPAGGELWWNGATWIAAPAPAPLPPPVPGFATPGLPPAPAGFPGMPGPR